MSGHLEMWYIWPRYALRISGRDRDYKLDHRRGFPRNKTGLRRADSDNSRLSRRYLKCPRYSEGLALVRQCGGRSRYA